ncbi:CvpA family protein [Pleionea mediterranea]|jgi:membrane protein required for colicin V production|uniref:Membrane protein required for colicin V production n=1 Tax=Pleionea mediterranea TaxID=523701 RepID=A0A316FLH6_9GAMM|nr:CvpA family protein [Pleionea mediterranea]PWK49113.1 membrane protein required for colicin V production [Pleionea mediterranea]
MVWFDWAILILILISTLISLVRGFIREAFSLAGWVLAFFVAKWFYLELASLLADHISTPSLRLGIAWGGLFFLTLTMSGLVNYLLSQFVERAGLSGMDRMMGMAFGALRGILVVAVLVISLKVFTPVEQDSWWQRSQLVSHFELIGGWFYDHLKNNSPNVSNNINISLDSE